MNKIDKLALGMMSMIPLLSGIIWHGLKNLSKDTDWQMLCESQSLAGWAVFGNMDLLPPETLEVYLWAGRILVVSVPFVIVWMIIKPILQSVLGV